MATYTNVSTCLLNLPDITPMIPHYPVDVSDECAANDRFQELIADGDIVLGEGPGISKEALLLLMFILTPISLGQWS